jgi:hypothetical protein
MARPEPPEGYVWHEDFVALTELLRRQIDAILTAVPGRIVARIEKDGLSLPLGEETARRLLQEETEHAKAEIAKLDLNLFKIPSRHQ